jgi:hypothetical protein
MLCSGDAAFAVSERETLLASPCVVSIAGHDRVLDDIDDVSA